MSQQKAFPLPSRGVDLLSDETALINNTVRSAVNVDIDRNGRFARRAGFTNVQPSSTMHSLNYAPQRGWTTVAEGSMLKRVDTSRYTLTDMFEMVSNYPIAYAEYNGNLYFTNRTAFGWLPSNSSVSRPVGTARPDAPDLSPGPGNLTPGKYGVVLTWVDDRGEQSGASDVRIIELTSPGGILLSGLTLRSGYTLYVYITSPDGDVLRRTAEFPAVFLTYLVTDTADGSICDTQYLAPMPPGDFLCWHNGRLVTALYDRLYLSRPGRPHYHDPAHDVIPMSGYISFIESVGDGLYVGDSRGVWFFSGTDPSKFEMKRVSTCRAVRHSSIMVPPEHFPPKMVTANEPVALWLSTSGYVVGQPGGAVVELHPDRIKVPTGLTGRSAFLLRDGRKQVVTPVNSTSTAAFGVAVDSVIS